MRWALRVRVVRGSCEASKVCKVQRRCEKVRVNCRRPAGGLQHKHTTAGCCCQLPQHYHYGRWRLQMCVREQVLQTQQPQRSCQGRQALPPSHDATTLHSCDRNLWQECMCRTAMRTKWVQIREREGEREKGERDKRGAHRIKHLHAAVAVRCLRCKILTKLNPSGGAFAARNDVEPRSVKKKGKKIEKLERDMCL